MALKEHPFIVTGSFTADGTTISYDKNAINRSTAVGKMFKINTDGKAELVSDGDEILGIVLAVDSDDMMTGAHIFAGLRLPIGKNATIARGDKIVGAVGASNAKGYVRSTTPATALDDLDANDIDDDTKKLAAYNAARTQITNLINAEKGRGTVIDFDDTDALVAFV